MEEEVKDGHWAIPLIITTFHFSFPYAMPTCHVTNGITIRWLWWSSVVKWTVKD